MCLPVAGGFVVFFGALGVPGFFVRFVFFFCMLMVPSWGPDSQAVRVCFRGFAPSLFVYHC